ncbi:hypothetical protein N9X05_03640 [Paracoccaceae bacterium]|nr:hypothetical protein [Paracoccaceae bacterium]
MSKRIFMTMLILIASLTFAGCSDTAFMNADERAEYYRVKRIKAAEEQRQKVERYKRETGGECETRSCYTKYKLRVRFETICVNYGHRKNTAAFNQCVGMERNNYERQQQLEWMEKEAAAAAYRAEKARKDEFIRDLQRNLRQSSRRRHRELLGF